MPAVQRSEFTLALNQVAAERGIDADVVLETVKQAILAAYRKDHPGIEPTEYEVKLNSANGEAQIYLNGEDVTPPGLGRIAAQTSKQVILQKIREAEKSAILTDFSQRIGTIVSGMVLRFDGPNVVVDIGKAEGVMPIAEQIPNEHYRMNQRITVFVSEIKEGVRGSEIIVSRAHKGLVEALFKREVPEVAQGSVVIKEIARDAGSRSKVAVSSNQSGVDPVGSCVGQKGVRVQAVINELGGIEKIDVIQWSDDIEKFIAQSLSPAKDVTVVLDKEKLEAVVTAPDDQLSLAIGKEGQNVRLASRITGYKIEIKGKGDTPKVEAVEEAVEPEIEGKEEAKESASAEASADKEKTEQA
jgi:transcription termination/antitermination protein NusA